ncbi:hypothetical protein [Streptomyces sp. NPDC002785]|uniref:hypothetical protein n=1 Tax=Streptomyces sp. NPDC002785 TaxID=3154543 RepID=UPI00331A35F6
MEQQTFTEQAGVAYAVIGKGKRVHYSPRNDDGLCGRAITAYLDVEEAVALFAKGYELCAPCHRAAEKRAEARRLADASPLAAALVDLVDTIEQADDEQAAADGTWRGEWIGAQDDDETLFPIERDTEQGALFTDRAAVEPAAEEQQATVETYYFLRTDGTPWGRQSREYCDGMVDLAVELGLARTEMVEQTVTYRPGQAATTVNRVVRESHPAAPAAVEPAAVEGVVEGVVVEHAGTAEGSTPSNASHPDVAAARVALARLAAATMTDHHDVTEPTEDERSVRGYLLDPRGQGRVALYWLEEGRIVRRDEQGYGASLDCLAWTMERAGWTVEKLRRSSQCVFAHRPVEAAAPAPVKPAAAVEPAPAAPAPFLSGDRVVCGDGQVRTVEGMTHRANEPARVVVAGGAEWIASECSVVPACLHRITVRADATGNPITACARKQSNQEAGVFTDEGCVEAYDCAVQAANRAAELNVEEDAPAGDPTYTWDLLCPDHRDAEQQVDECEECNAVEAAEQTAADVVEQAVVEETPRCITHGAECDDAPKRRHQFEPTADMVEAAREAKRQAKAKTAAHIAELDDVLAMIEQAERVDGTWRGEWIAAAPADAELLDLPADAEQGALFA